MGTIIARILNNPMLLVWIAGICFVAGLTSGGSSAWWLQGLRLKALQGEYDTFVAKTATLGEQAKAEAIRKESEDKLDKERRDAEVKDLRIAAATISKQLWDEQRTSRRAMSKVRGTAGDPARACFRAAEFDAASQRFDEGLGEIEERIQRLGDEGNDCRIALDAAKRKAQGLR